MNESNTITTLDVEGVTCGGCVATLRRVLGALPGVREVEVDQATGRTVVRHEAGGAGQDEFRAAIEEAGYDVA